jgi:hypothetical protein
MLIQSLKTHFSARTMEWWGAGAMFTWGYYFVTHPQLLTQTATKELFAGLTQVTDFFGQPPIAIGLMAIITGMVRASALFINGAYAKTPLIRLLTAFLSAYIWTSITVGFYVIDAPNTGLVVYPWLVVADVISGYRAGYDLVIAENVARKVRSFHGQQPSRRRGLYRLVRRVVFSSHS